MSHLIRAARRLVVTLCVALATAAAVAPAASGASTLVAEPDEVSFGDVVTGQQRSLPVTIRNLGPDTVTFGDMWLGYEEGATVEPFSVALGSCDVDFLDAGAACEMAVTFAAPPESGSFAALLVVEGDTGAVEPAVALLTGQSVAPPPPPPVLGRLVAEPVTVKFPRTRIGSVSAAQEVRVRNSGSGPIALPPAAIANPHFQIVSNNCPSVLAAGAVCNVSVIFKPEDGPPLPIGYLVGGVIQRDLLAFGDRDPVTRRFPLAVILTGDTRPALEVAAIQASLAGVSRSVPKVLRGGPGEAFLTAFKALEAGTLAVRVYGRLGKRRVLIGKGSDRFTKGERYELPLAVTRRGRKMLRQPKRTPIKVELGFTTTDKIATTWKGAFKVKPPKAKRPAKPRSKRR